MLDDREDPSDDLIEHLHCQDQGFWLLRCLGFSSIVPSKPNPNLVANVFKLFSLKSLIFLRNDGMKGFHFRGSDMIFINHTW